MKLFLSLTFAMISIMISALTLTHSSWVPISYKIIKLDRTIEEIQFAQLTSRYINNKQTSLQDTTLKNRRYSQKEINHLDDVREVINLTKTALILTLILASLILLKKAKSKTNITMQILTGLKQAQYLIVTVGLIGIAFWETAFTLFHKILFKEGTWLFYQDDLLIVLFPPKFWMLSATTMFLLSLILLKSVEIVIRRSHQPKQTTTQT